jgi:hypothetical protein
MSFTVKPQMPLFHYCYCCMDLKILLQFVPVFQATVSIRVVWSEVYIKYDQWTVRLTTLSTFVHVSPTLCKFSW